MPPGSQNRPELHNTWVEASRSVHCINNYCPSQHCDKLTQNDMWLAQRRLTAAHSRIEDLNRELSLAAHENHILEVRAAQADEGCLRLHAQLKVGKPAMN